MPILSVSGRNSPLACDSDGMVSSESALAEADRHPQGQPETGPGPTVGRQPGGDDYDGDEMSRAHARSTLQAHPVRPPTLAAPPPLRASSIGLEVRVEAGARSRRSENLLTNRQAAARVRAWPRSLRRGYYCPAAGPLALRHFGRGQRHPSRCKTIETTPRPRSG